MGGRLIVGAAAGLLTTVGLVGLGMHDDDAGSSRLARLPETSLDASTSGLLLPSSTRASVGGKRVARPIPSPEDTQPPVSVSIPVDDPLPPADVTEPVEVVVDPDPGCTTANLTVIAIEGCPLKTLPGGLLDTSKEAAALPE